MFRGFGCFVLLALLAVVLFRRGSKLTSAFAAVVVALLIGASASAQDAPIQNFYAAGVSYNGSGSPAVAGTALYAHQIGPVDTAPGLYSFVVYDAVPNSGKPLVLTNSVGAGFAQKLFTVAGVDVFAPTSAGVAFTGPNVGWAWSGGLMAPVRYKQTSYYITPAVRLSKASVGGAGYTPMLSLMVGWGK